nr:MAG TPA: Regulatory protein [Caudoviricetes sp.]
MVNVSKLKGKIVESGYSIAELSYKIGIDKATFYRKLNSNGENFSVREANAIVKELKMNGEEAVSIFFA